MTDSILDKLIQLYGREDGADCYARLMAKLDDFRAQHPDLSARPIDPAQRVTERDVMLITYGDSLWEPEIDPLKTLNHFLQQHLAGTLSAVHILPFFPYSSDDGFSVIDYTAVNPSLGDWPDIRLIGQRFRLMFDAVINHISAQSPWFQAFLNGDPDYQDFFIRVDPAVDLSQVVRPRSLPVLTPVQTRRGEEHVWTTFSADQIDLNFAHPAVLLKIVDVLLFYVSQGMSFIRLDAIAYLWKRIGTGCIHLEETHTVIKLFRDIFDLVAPSVSIITETNVPHAENVSYFGDGSDEAQLVYQFTLPPLMLHAFAVGDAVVLSDWAARIEIGSHTTTFFNFTASHDGIGVRPVEGILSGRRSARWSNAPGHTAGRYRSRPTATARKVPTSLILTTSTRCPIRPVMSRWTSRSGALSRPRRSNWRLWGCRGSTSTVYWGRAVGRQGSDKPGGCARSTAKNCG